MNFKISASIFWKPLDIGLNMQFFSHLQITVSDTLCIESKELQGNKAVLYLLVDVACQLGPTFEDKHMQDDKFEIIFLMHIKRMLLSSSDCWMSM